MSLKRDILSRVGMYGPITSANVAESVGTDKKTMRRYLLNLYRAGEVNRRIMGRQDTYHYFAIEGAEVEKTTEEDLEEKFVALPGDADVDAAIAVAGPGITPRMYQREGQSCPQCHREVIFEPWHTHWKVCPLCQWIVRR
jgi:hypothetical protein